jgi:nitroreductase
MEVYEAVRTVLAVRKYQDKPVPKEVLRRIVEAGRLTASSMNGQPWHFTVVDDRDTLRKLGALVKTGPYIAGAAAAVVVSLDKTPYAVSDGSRAVQSMILAAWSEGVASNWVGFMGMSEIKPLLGIPAGQDVLAVVSLGYPAQATGRGKKQRKPLGEVASRGRYGQPYP